MSEVELLLAFLAGVVMGGSGLHERICSTKKGPGITPVEDVFDYVADECNEPRYNAQMRHAEKISDGPIGVGTQYRAEVVSGGRPVSMVIEVTAYERPGRLASMTTMSAMDVAYTLTFGPVREGTRTRWSGEIEPHGMLKRIGPLVAWMGRRQELRIWTGLKGLLEGKAELAP